MPAAGGQLLLAALHGRAARTSKVMRGLTLVRLHQPTVHHRSLSGLLGICWATCMSGQGSNEIKFERLS